MEKVTTDTSTRTIRGNSIEKMRVLFIDNSPSDHLYDLDGKIDLCNTTTGQAVKQISEKHIVCDAVVVDASVDSADIKILRKATSDRDLPLILYSSFFDEEMKRKALKLNADDYLSGSMRYSLASQIKLIKQLRKFRIQWLEQENKYKLKKYLPSVGEIFSRRVPDVTVSFAALILLSPAILILAIVQEIEVMEDHVFSGAKNKSFGDRVYNWYHFTALILFSPIFAVIKMPLRFKSNGLQYHHCTDKNANTSSTSMLIETAFARLPYLTGILKGDISFFRERSPLKSSVDEIEQNLRLL